MENLEDRCLPASVFLALGPVVLGGPVNAGLYSGPVDTFTESGRTNVQASDFRAIINWGDNTPVSFGTVQQQQPNGPFQVLGSHTYQPGTYSPTVTVSDTTVAGITRTRDSAQWSPAASMSSSRAGLAAAADAAGHIYALGGIDRNSITLNTVEVYDSAAQTWSGVKSMQNPRRYLAGVATLDGRVFAIGGMDANRNLLSTVEVYDPASDSWSYVAPMPAAILGMSAVVGKDGRIYVFGGTNDANELGRPTDSVLVYDPASNTWSTAAPMPTAASYTSSVTGPDGRIHVFGGFGGRGIDGSNDIINIVFSGVQVYSPMTNTWSTAERMPTARYSTAAATGPDGRIYVIGGTDTSIFENVDLHVMEAYDPNTGRWSQSVPLPISRVLLAAAADTDGHIYAIGGSNAGEMASVEALSVQAVHVLPGSLTAGTINLTLTQDTPFSGTVASFQSSNTLEKAVDFAAVIHWGDGTPDSTGTISGALGQFTVSGSHTFALAGNDRVTVDIADTDGDHVTAGGALHWTEAAPMLTARNGLAAVTGPDGRIYALAGAGTDPLGTAEVYDPETGTWSAIAPMPTARTNLAAVTGPDGRIYALGGYNNGYLSTVEAYDPETNSWSSVAPMPTAREFLAAVAGADGRIYAIGGYGAGFFGLRNTVEAYDPATNTWATVASMPTARFGLAAVALPDGRIYALGGANSNSLNTLEVYDPATEVWTTAAAMPTARYFLGAALGPDGRIYAVGGLDSDSISTVEAYDPETNSWSTAAPLATARSLLAAVTGPDGRIYALGGVDNNHSVLAYVEILNDGVSAQVAPHPANHLVVSGFPPITAGVPATFTVTAEDALGHTVSNYAGTVSFAASGTANLPAPATLTNGTGTFTATLLTAGLQSLAVSDGMLSGEENAIVVSPAGAAQVSILSGNAQNTLVNTNYAQPLEVAVTDAYGNPIDGDTVVFTAPASGPDGTFSGSNTATVPTDSLGMALAPTFTADGQGGSFSVTATAAGVGTPATFSETNLANLSLTTGMTNSLTVSPSTPSFGQLVSVTAQVGNTSLGSTATPNGGFVIISDNGRQIGVALLSNGAATIQTTFTGGSQYLSATYTGSGNFEGSSTQTLTTLQVTRLTTSVALTTSPSALVQAGQSVTLSAQVSGPAGMVTFFDGSTALGAVAVDVGSSVATLSVPALSFGAHTLIATFTPADILDYAPSSSSVPFTVTAAAPASIVVASGSSQSVLAGSAFAAPLVATVTDKYGDPVAGVNVTFSAPSSGASASFPGGNTVTTDAQGQASVYVQANAKGGNYSVLASVNGLTAASFKLTNLFATTTMLKTNTANLVFGQSVLLTSTVSGPAGTSRATGSVTFYDQGDALGTVPLVKGVAKLVVHNLDVGSDSYTATYNGNTVYATSGSSAVSTTTAQAGTRIKLITSSATPQFGDTLTLTATLRAVKPATGIPGGTVSFVDGSSVLGTVNLIDGVASLSTSALAVGGHTITVVYGGDDNFLAGTSAALTETVAQAQVNVQLSASPIITAQGVTFSVTVTPVNGGSTSPTGTIKLYDGTTMIGMATLSGGMATLTISNLKKGMRSITASYSGDSDFLSGTSDALQVTIN
jgi:N-acetylneuraminic acid mutarotase